ncbi:unnamed protein product [Didymodactylos carnosus]|uniref:Uncharacterized protein n=1 Tax=Didymodactylos carnosus TaxID=1234261 RepID=A0A814RXQ8_9BILA|nr:unnamed protein product [Didymodactylos carnosus]CAF1140416.1 unnamed protein product [Didymodactylos carnosus]CAF3557993.1 unnamed protein product [Didymodactylos carnosus]CAF3904100.1 unnamed protein product [Didymodactylos carnosus]
MSLSDYAVKIRTKNADLKKKILLYKHEIPLIENEILMLKITYDELNGACKRLDRLVNENETNNTSLLLENQHLFKDYIKDIQTDIEIQHHKYNSNPKWKSVSQQSNSLVTNTIEISSDIQQQPAILISPMISQLISVENWFADSSKSHSSVHDDQKLDTLSIKRQQDEQELLKNKDDEDDLYKGLISGACEEGELDNNINENEEHAIEEIPCPIIPTTTKTPQSSATKSLRHYTLMRHLAEKKSIKKS